MSSNALRPPYGSDLQTSRILVLLAALVALATACDSPPILPDEPEVIDTQEAWPLDAGGQGSGAPTHYKGLSLELTERPEPTVSAVDGVIAVVCVGMSNARQECDHFIQGVEGVWSGAVAEEVRVVNCARGGHAIERWIDPAFDEELWLGCHRRLEGLGIAVDQVRVVLHKAANQFTTGADGSALPPYPDPRSDYFAFMDNLDAFAGRVGDLFPAVSAVYTTSRSYGGFAGRAARGEPLSYEEGHALNSWLTDHARVDGVWFGWGPYIWAPACDTGRVNGSGLCYEREDFQADGVHPADNGRSKIAALWHEHLLQAKWYRR